MQISTLIIGNGLCGTWLSYWLQQAGSSFMVIDNKQPNSASRVSSGIINPVTGRRMVETWLADTLLPFSARSYRAMGRLLGKDLIEQKSILDFFAAPDRKISFEKRVGEKPNLLAMPLHENEYRTLFNYDFGFGIIKLAYQVSVQEMLGGWQQKLEQEGLLMNETFDPQFLQLKKQGIQYKHITADRLIFCDGTAALQSRYFKNLPFAFNKGEALIVSIDGLSDKHIYKKTNTITPWKPGLFWVGSTYDRGFTDDRPSELFYEETNQWLKHFLKMPFKIEDHVAAIRPTTVERRPFVGMHPVWSTMGILNGMGTKGVSLAPYFARQLADHITKAKLIMPEAAVERHAKLLSYTDHG